MKYITITLLILLICGCTFYKELGDVEKIFIHVNGRKLELVADEYGNQYIKQKVMFEVIYIPFTFPTEDDEIPRVYEAKSKNYGTPSK